MRTKYNVSGTDIACPFCKGKMRAVSELPALTHTLPMCERFVRMDLPTFVEAVNAERRRRILEN